MDQLQSKGWQIVKAQRKLWQIIYSTTKVIKDVGVTCVFDGGKDAHFHTKSTFTNTWPD